MIEIDIPGRTVYKLSALLLDVNGTITLDGIIIDGVTERIKSLSDFLDIYLITADTQGTAKHFAEALSVRLTIIMPGNEDYQKLDFIQKIGSESTVAIGNGSNDSLMLREAAIGICISSKEGAAQEAVQNCDVLMNDINSALDLLLKPKRLIATLRK